jgi:hypothetical protein
MERKYSCNISLATGSRDEDYLFRKKREDPLDCYTPKLPKYTYDDRFKKLASPTSTDNSDTRSPPNKFADIPDIRRRRLGV